MPFGNGTGADKDRGACSVARLATPVGANASASTGAAAGARAGAEVSIRHVSFRHKGAPEGTFALDNVSIEVPAGQVLVLCGRSGCGKTTVTRLVNGLIPQFYEGDLWGEVSVDGLDPSTASVTDTAAIVGSVFQNPRSQFFNVDTTSELVFACENMGWDVESIDRAFKGSVARFRLSGLLDRSLFKLSGGEKQKIACAGASAHCPRVLVLDEPASNLDMSAIRMLAGIISEWKAEGRTVIVAEHRLGYLMDVADRFVLLEPGRVAWDKTTSEVGAMFDDELHAYGLRSVRPIRFAGLHGSTSSGDSEQEDCTDSAPTDCTKRAACKDEGAKGGIDVRRLRFAHRSGDSFAETLGSGGLDVRSEIENKGEAEATRSAERGASHGIDVEGIVFHQGAIIGVIGDNGAGKSTFARCLCGLEKRCDDDISFDGRRMRASERRRLCYLVMQDVNHQLFTESVREEVVLSLRNRVDKRAAETDFDDEVASVLSGLDLEELADFHPMALSGGQKQRVAIASAVASGRQVCVFDEPTSGLDWAHMLDTARNIRSLAGRGIICLVVTHDPELIACCCDDVLFVENGKVAWGGPLSDVEIARCLQSYFSSSSHDISRAPILSARDSRALHEVAGL